MPHAHAVRSPLEPGELADEVRRLFEEIDRAAQRTLPGPTGECSPTLDVIETDAAIEVVVDLPGIGAESLRVVLLRGTLLIVGEKNQPAVSLQHDAVFHLVERGFGRFARAVHLAGAVDGSHAGARLAHGELRVVLRKIDDRRGREFRIAIKDGT